MFREKLWWKRSLRVFVCICCCVSVLSVCVSIVSRVLACPSLPNLICACIFTCVPVRYAPPPPHPSRFSAARPADRGVFGPPRVSSSTSEQGAKSLLTFFQTCGSWSVLLAAVTRRCIRAFIPFSGGRCNPRARWGDVTLALNDATAEWTCSWSRLGLDWCAHVHARGHLIREHTGATRKQLSKTGCVRLTNQLTFTS